MYCCTGITKRRIQTHYDLATVFYWLLWGRHIHHGLWAASESPAEAQDRLTDTLAQTAGIGHGQHVLDVGCGMGGSSIRLVQTRGCRVTGITVSPVQRSWAAWMSRFRRTARRTDFRCQDAELAQFDAGRFDVVWSIECTEHLFDKAAFFSHAASWLRPGGKLAICAWQAADDSTPAKRELLQRVCQGFLCPSLGTMEDYATWMTEAGLVVERREDWTSQVTRTWEICIDRARKTGVRWLAKALNRDQVSFLDNFQTILDAYRSGAMQYGCLVATAPSMGSDVLNG